MALLMEHFGVDHLALLFTLVLGTSGEPFAMEFADLAAGVYRETTGRRAAV